MNHALDGVSDPWESMLQRRSLQDCSAAARVIQCCTWYAVVRREGGGNLEAFEKVRREEIWHGELNVS